MVREPSGTKVGLDDANGQKRSTTVTLRELFPEPRRGIRMSEKIEMCGGAAESGMAEVRDSGPILCCAERGAAPSTDPVLAGFRPALPSAVTGTSVVVRQAQFGCCRVTLAAQCGRLKISASGFTEACFARLGFHKGARSMTSAMQLVPRLIAGHYTGGRAVGATRLRGPSGPRSTSCDGRWHRTAGGSGPGAAHARKTARPESKRRTD